MKSVLAVVVVLFASMIDSAIAGALSPGYRIHGTACVKPMDVDDFEAGVAVGNYSDTSWFQSYAQDTVSVICPLPVDDSLEDKTLSFKVRMHAYFGPKTVTCKAIALSPSNSSHQVSTTVEFDGYTTLELNGLKLYYMSNKALVVRCELPSDTSIHWVEVDSII